MLPHKTARGQLALGRLAVSFFISYIYYIYIIYINKNYFFIIFTDL